MSFCEVVCLVSFLFPLRARFLTLPSVTFIALACAALRAAVASTSVATVPEVASADRLSVGFGTHGVFESTLTLV